jgi:small conductance mechanosensitive channel
MELGEEVIALAWDWGARITGALLLLLVAWIASAWIGRLVLQGLERARVDLTLARFMSKFARWTVLVLSLITCLSVFGIQTTSFAAVLGAAGLAIGLAFQGTLSNFASGLMLLVFRPYKIGDYITVGGVSGNVYELDLFRTTLDTPDNRRIMVPNSKVFGDTIENVTFHKKRRVDLTFGTDYGANLDTVRAALNEAVAETNGVLDDPAPQVVLTDILGDSVNWTLRLWCATSEYGDVRERALVNAKKKLDAAGIGNPRSDVDVRLQRTPET